MQQLKNSKFSNKVLLVDDEKSIRMSLAQSIELAGFEVITCASAEAALQQLRAQWDGVIVSDISMPGMDGLTLMGQISSIDSDIPMILMTGHGDISMAVSAIKQGAYDFLEKPFSTLDILPLLPLFWRNFLPLLPLI